VLALSDLYREYGDTVEAAAVVRRALETAPDDPRYRLKLEELGRGPF